MRLATCKITGREIVIEDCKLEFDKTKLAWASGFYDGEGCTQFSSRNAKYEIPIFRLQANQKYKGVLIKLKKVLLNYGGIYGPYTDRNGKRIYNYFIEKFEEAQMALILLWPELGEIKRQQAKEAMREYLVAVHRTNFRRL